MSSISNYFQTLKLKKKRNPLLKPRPARFPIRTQRAYVHDLKEVVLEMKKAIDKEVIAFLPSIENKFKVENGRFDDWTDDLFRLLANARTAFSEAIPLVRLRSIIQRRGFEVNNHTLEQFANQTKQIAGVSLIANSNWTVSQLKGFVQQNVTLIKSVEDTLFKEVEQAVYNGLERGANTATIAQEIADRTDVSISRAALIARDQVSKLNGLMAAKRQQDAGVTEFIWETSGDNRVRDSHAELNGKQFTYKEGATVDGESGVLPGLPINCRCVATPVFGSVAGLEGLSEFD